MSELFKSDLFRFSGGFALGAIALVGLRPEAFASLSAWVGAVAHAV